jgi:hypothetical protein
MPMIYVYLQVCGAAWARTILLCVIITADAEHHLNLYILYKPMAAAPLTPSIRPPVDFHAWIEEVKPELQPPVGMKPEQLTLPELRTP